ncbi:MAG TPA: hypothetical protein VL242_09045, partial [Sorangium sp.]|nr:hypothetical protein [Sorangium sp.]
MVCASALAVAMAAACGDDDGGASTASTSTASGTGGGGGGGGGGGDGGGGKGGGGDGPDCAAPVEIAESIEADATWSADSCYLMKGTIFVEEGATLTIEPGTTIMGDKESLATLVVKPGAKISAKG